MTSPAIVPVSSREEAEMSALKYKLWRRRLKSGKKWPTWLRDPRLLKWAFYIGGITYRLWRRWLSLTGPTDG